MTPNRLFQILFFLLAIILVASILLGVNPSPLGTLLLLLIIFVAIGLVRIIRNKRHGFDEQPTKVPVRRVVAQNSDPVPPQGGNRSQDVPLSQKSQPQTAREADVTPAIFISYRRDDSSDVTGRIYDRLIQHFGKHSVFKDVDSIPLGVDFRKHLGNSVGGCDVLLAVIGRQWLIGEVGQRRLDDVRDFVRIELEAALQRDIPVVPVLVQAALAPRLEDLPETLQSLVYRNGIPVRPDPDFHHDVDRLIKGIEGCLSRKRNQ